MKKLIHKLFLIGGIFFLTATISSCSKDDNGTETTTSSHEQDYFLNYTLKSDQLVSLSVDDNVDITNKFAGFTFRFTKTGALNGTVAASNDLLTINGTWTVDEGYNNITFGFNTDIIADFAFMNKTWLIEARGEESMQLKAANGENDRLHFSKK